MDVVIFANVINALGALLSFYANYAVGHKEDKKVIFGFSMGNATLICVGSLLLSSYPPVLLNIVWFIIGYIGYKNITIPRCFCILKHTLPFLFLIGVFMFYQGYYLASSYAAVAIYIVSFTLLSGNLMSRLQYLYWCLTGYLFIVPHLYNHQSYSILVMESISVVISIISIRKLLLTNLK